MRAFRPYQGGKERHRLMVNRTKKKRARSRTISEGPSVDSNVREKKVHDAVLRESTAEHDADDNDETSEKLPEVLNPLSNVSVQSGGIKETPTEPKDGEQQQQQQQSKTIALTKTRLHRWDASCWDLLDAIEAANRTASDTEIAELWRVAWNEAHADAEQPTVGDEDEEDTDFSQTEVVIRVQALRGVQSLRRRRSSLPSTKKRKRTTEANDKTEQQEGGDNSVRPAAAPSSFWKRVKGIFA